MIITDDYEGLDNFLKLILDDGDRESSLPDFSGFIMKYTENQIEVWNK